MFLSSVLLAAVTLFSAPAAEAAPRRDQVHIQAQTGLLSRAALRVDEVDADRQQVALGPGAGGVDLGVGYLLRGHSEVGVRLEMSRMTVDNGLSEASRGHARMAGTYSFHLRHRSPLHFTATGLLGVERTSFDGAALARGPFVGLAGSAHYFATPRLSVSAGLEATRSLGGRYEQDGLDGSSRFAASEVAAVAGLHFYMGSGNRRGAARR